jgi:hypothetical protein
MNKKEIAGYFFEFDEYYQGWLNKLDSREFKIVFEDELIQNEPFVKDKLKSFSGEYLSKVNNLVFNSLFYLSKTYFNSSVNHDPLFTLDSIIVKTCNQMELNYYLYLRDKAEGDNYGVWVAMFESSNLYGVVRRQL